LETAGQGLKKFFCPPGADGRNKLRPLERRLLALSQCPVPYLQLHMGD